MAAPCVNCHNTHPDSPKRDWKVGDVRGIEEFTINQPIAAHIFAFKYLLLYFTFVAVTGLAFIALQRYQSTLIARFNEELGRTNEFLSGLAKKIAKYLPPQLYRGIFAGEKDVEVATERKKLTVFFSDVVNFTSDHRADAAGGAHGPAQRIPDRNVVDRRRARRHDQQIHR